MCKADLLRAIPPLLRVTVIVILSSLQISPAALALAQDDKTACDVPAVEPMEKTFVTCHFPEDISQTKKDFTVNLYHDPGNSDAVLDCWWFRGKLDCQVNPKYSFNREISHKLVLEIPRVLTQHLGIYACQFVNIAPEKITTCNLNFILGKENTCRVDVSTDIPGRPAFLTCLFNEDIQITQRNFTVYKYTGESRLGVVECWWDEVSRLECRTEAGYRVDDDVSSYIEVELPNGTQDVTASYSCWHTGSIQGQQNTCSLPGKGGPSHEGTVLSIALGVGLSVGLVVMASLLFFLLLRRKGRHGRRIEDTSADNEGGKPLLKMKKTPEEITKRFQEVLALELKATYPKIDNDFHFVPPLYFNKTRCRKQSVGGDFVFVLDPSDPCDVRHDRAMQHVMHCLRHVTEQGHEPMFVLTQFQYEDYLNNPGPEYKRHCLPMPAGLKGGDKHVGCLDFLIVHREHGLLVGVVTAVSEQDVEGEDDEHKKYEAVVAAVTEAVKQFRKAERMIKHLLSDQPHVLTVRHTLVLPNLTTSSLRSAVARHSSLIQDLREGFGLDSFVDPSELCLCADDLSDASTPWDVSSDVVCNIGQKWKWSDASDSAVWDDFYLTILARFFGPATRSTLQVPDEYERFTLPKTLSEAVSLTGDLCGRYTIHADLLELLDEPQVLLFGPSDFDKTRILELAGRKWLSTGHNIFIVTASSTDRRVSQALTELTMQNAQSTANPNCGRAFYQECDFTSQATIKKHIQEITGGKGMKQFYILLAASHVERESVSMFCETLLTKVPDVCLWVSCLHGDVCPRITRGWQVTEDLNCPPAVLREVLTSNPIEAAHKVDYLVYPSLTDGAPVKHFHHQQTRRFSGFPWVRRSCDCLECGQKVGNFLTNTLLVSTTEPTTNATVRQTADYPLKCKDILILFEIEQDIAEDKNFLQGLRMSGVKVQAVKVEKYKVVAADDGDSAWAMNVRHMETYRTKRKIVVYVEVDSEYKDLENKRRALTSCTSQLILVSHGLR